MRRGNKSVMRVERQRLPLGAIDEETTKSIRFKRSSIGAVGVQMTMNDFNDPYVSSYNAHFRKNNELDVREWKNRFANVKVNNKVDGNMIQWAGTYHQRKDFNKKVDHMKDWTEILFKQ